LEWDDGTAITTFIPPCCRTSEVTERQVRRRLKGRLVKQTPLYDFHVQHGARIVDFAGWQMPLLYTGIVPEHIHTRQVGSLFDVSHMGRIEVQGPQAEELLERVCTRRLGDAQVGQSRYSHVCNEAGGILDDVIVSRYERHWLVVCNAANRERIVAWLGKHAADRDVELRDVTEQTLMVAVQGPAVMETLAGRLPIPIDALKKYRFTTGAFMGIPYTIARSGYTGEDGVELILPASVAGMIGSVLPTDDEASIKPAGLGARDTLRLEAGMPLYGHELSEETDSLSAGLVWCVDLTKDFIGADHLRALAAEGAARKLVGIELEGRRIARPGTRLRDGSDAIGTVTSGTFSPTLEKSIAMAYVRSEASESGRELTAELGGKTTTQARVVSLPFYKRSD
jgi:aminomethyltransferase